MKPAELKFARRLDRASCAVVRAIDLPPGSLVVVQLAAETSDAQIEQARRLLNRYFAARGCDVLVTRTKIDKLEVLTAAVDEPAP